MSNTRVCILGAGNMGRALLGGLLRSGTRAEFLSLGEPSTQARADIARELGVTGSADNLEAVRGAAVVVLAVKPQHVAAVLTPLAAALGASAALLVSVAAGVRIAALEACCPGVPVMRAMPNRPALVGAGVSGAFAPEEVSPAHRAAAQRVLQAVGEVVWVKSEDALDTVTALSGSGPAYFFLLAELMAEAGSELGLDPATAARLARVTLYGAGLMANSVDGALADLRAQVTSPGGTTAAALAAFTQADFADTVRRALTAAARRSRELAAASGG
jgi:pyrroline-5-carboxylate reductase